MSTHYYALLGVGAEFTPDELDKRRKALAQALHPDRAGGSAERMAEVNAAHACLSDPPSHKLYRAALRSTYPMQCSLCSGTGYRSKQRGFTATVRTVCATCTGAGLVGRTK